MPSNQRSRSVSGKVANSLFWPRFYVRRSRAALLLPPTLSLALSSPSVSSPVATSDDAGRCPGRCPGRCGPGPDRRCPDGLRPRARYDDGGVSGCVPRGTKAVSCGASAKGGRRSGSCPCSIDGAVFSVSRLCTSRRCMCLDDRWRRMSRGKTTSLFCGQGWLSCAWLTRAHD